jgi:hypothetical protein
VESVLNQSENASKQVGKGGLVGRVGTRYAQ